MNYTGLTRRYPVNRPLTKREIEHHLLPKKPSPANETLDHLTVIKMNSTYLECVDKYYPWAGFITLVTVSFAAVIFWAMAGLLSTTVHRWSTLSVGDRWEEVWAIIAIFAVMLPVLWLLFWYLFKEIFCYTHYPMRFNRKTRMVHVFRLDGTVMSESWDKLYFTVTRGQLEWWDIQGHRLADDGVTVLETFALAYYDNSISPYLFRQWEFIRCYMEKGPEKLIDQVINTMDVAEHKETFWFGFHRIMGEFGQYALIAWIFSPFVLACAIGRWIAMQTSKIPVWPAEIETECQVDPNDPYQRDEYHPHPSQQVHRGGVTA
jgi:hypothetical protein